jgi:hypothetical protein
VPFGPPGFVVQGTKALAQRRILDHQEMPGLHIPAVWGPDGRFQNVAYSRIRDGIGFQAPEDVSEVLVCYSLGVYETQSNPQANRVIS